MSIMATAVSIAEGRFRQMWVSGAAHLEKHGRGAQSLLQPIAQTMQGVSTVSSANRALTTLNQNKLPGAFRWAAFIVPTIAFLVQNNLGDGRVKTVLGAVNNHLGSVFRIAFVVSQVALLYFTGSVVAGAALGFFVLETLDTNELLPKRIAAIHSAAQTPLFWASLALTATSWGPVIACTVYLGLKQVMTRLFKQKSVAPEAPKEALTPDPQGNIGRLTPEILHDILTKNRPECDFEINLQHLYWDVLPPIPDEKPEELLNLWDRIDWTQHQQGVPPAQVAPLRAKLAGHVDRWKADSYESSLPFYYYVRIAVERLKSEHSELKRAQILTRLARHGDHELQEAFALFTEPTGNIPLRKAILQKLQFTRTQDHRHPIVDFILSHDGPIVPTDPFLALGLPHSGVGPLGLLPRKRELRSREHYRLSQSDRDILSTLRDRSYDLHGILWSVNCLPDVAKKNAGLVESIYSLTAPCSTGCGQNMAVSSTRAGRRSSHSRS